MTRVLRSPLWWIPIGAALTWLPMTLAGVRGWPLSLAGLCLYSIANPLACAFASNWWAATILSGVSWFVIFVALGALPAMAELREGAMVFMLPMMIYPVAVLVSGIIRIVRRRRAAPAA